MFKLRLFQTYTGVPDHIAPPEEKPIGNLMFITFCVRTMTPPTRTCADGAERL